MRYFDHNATHPLSAAARTAWLDAVERFPANPSSPHRWGARADAALNDARSKVARWLGCRPEEIVWTSGATESNNAIIQHLAATTSGPVLVSALEHPSVRVAAKRWLGRRLEEIPADPSGVVDTDRIAARLNNRDMAAVLAMAANNETGVLQPWSDIHDLCARFNVPFACDAAQWLGRLPESSLGACAYLAGCGHKFGGPQGVGFLKGPVDLHPILVGGPQEDGRRAGTENVAGILALVAAWEDRRQPWANSETPMPDALKERLAWRDRFVEDLKEALPGVEIVGESAPRLWNTVAALMPPAADCRRRWVVKLDKLGFAVSTGSACASGREKPSHVLVAMGRSPDESDRLLRFSAGWETTPDDWSALLAALRAADAELRDPSSRASV